MRLKRLFLVWVFGSGMLNGVLAPAAWAQAAPAALAPESSSSAGNSGASAKTNGAAGAENPQIQPGDVVSIIVYPAEEYSREVTVQPDGKIELALIGTLQVRGLTAKEVAALLESKYGRYVDNPKISVSTRHFAGRRVAIIGEIKSSGYYEYRDGMRLLELVSLAGGLGDNAKPSRVTVLRQGSNKAIKFDFQKVLDGRVESDIALLPGDTIVVPKTILSKKATWLTNNILPWLTFVTAAATLVILAKQ